MLKIHVTIFLFVCLFVGVCVCLYIRRIAKFSRNRLQIYLDFHQDKLFTEDE